MKSRKRVLTLCLALVMGLSLMTAALAGDEFSDVRPKDWYYNDVTECAKLGVVNGYNGKFSPNDPVTGVQFASMLTRTFYADELAEIEPPTASRGTIPTSRPLRTWVSATVR